MTFKQWILGEGVTRIPTSEYLFGPKHLIMLFATIAVTLIISLIFRKKSVKSQKILLGILIGACILLETVQKSVNMFKLDVYNFDNVYKVLIPCHFCAIVMYALIIAYFIKRRGFTNAVTIGGLLASTAYLVHPAVGINTDIITLSQFYTIATHCLGFLICVLLIVFKMVSFKVKEIYQPIIFIGGSVLYALFLNLVLFPGSNYMYFVHNELSFDVNIHLYRLGLLLIVSVFVISFYLPDIIKRVKQKNKLVKAK